MKKSEFIPTIAPIVIAENNRRGKPLYPSVVIGQAILESGWGQSKIMMKANAIFGIKATKSWKGKVYSAKTQECYDGVNYTTITDLFRAYDSLDESIKDYFDLICDLSRYSQALFAESPKACITAIKKNGGYATSPTYIDNVMSVINSNNLTQYDNVENVENNVNKKSNEEIANEIMYKENYGGWGTGELRKQLLKDAGYNYNEIQAIINSRYGQSASNDIIKVGDKVEVIKNEQYNGKSFRVYYKVYNVIEIKDDRAVIGIDNIVTCAINIKNIRKVK
jgi:hypothetical protein